jgi:hypothetical protein
MPEGTADYSIARARSLHHEPMRRFAFSLLATVACTSDASIDLRPIAPCDACAVGHLRAGVEANDGSWFGWDGVSLIAWREHTVSWLTPDLATARSASPQAAGAEAPQVRAVASAADGHGFVLESATEGDVVGEDFTLIGLDAGGGTPWQTAIFHRASYPSYAIAAAAARDLVMLASASNGPTMVPGQATTPPIRIARLSGDDGTARWVKRWDDPRVTATGVAALAGGDVIVVGKLDGGEARVELGGSNGSLVGPGMFIVRLSTSGDVVWSRVFRGTASAGGRAVTIGDGDRIYVLGDFGGALDLGDGTVLAPPPEDVDAHDVVIAMDAAGAIAWTATPTFSTAHTLAASPRGVIVGLDEDRAAQIGGVNLPVGDGYDGACVELVGGTATWSLVASGPGYQRCDAVATVNGRSFVALESWAPVGAARASMTVDGRTFQGDTRVLAEVVTSP